MAVPRPARRGSSVGVGQRGSHGRYGVQGAQGAMSEQQQAAVAQRADRRQHRPALARRAVVLEHGQGRIDALFGDWSAAEQAELGRVLGHLNEVLERYALGS
jgi:hypothetical protein